MQMMPTPNQIRAYLDQYVIGQDAAKRVLAVAVYNHYKKATLSAQGGGDLSKSNILMIGPTGSGKTHIVSTLANALNVPFAMADATSFIASGVGKGVEDMLARLIQKADYDVAKAERGIIYIDEIDKISAKYADGGEGIQQALLKTIEGTIASVPMRAEGQHTHLNTKNILFIVGGAFVGLETIIGMRMHGGATLLDHGSLMKDITPSDIVRFGLIPEFVGRLPVIVILHELSKQALMDILTKPKNSLLEQYKKMFELDQLELIFSEASIEQVADKAIQMKTGARGLRTILESSMRDIMYSAPSQQNLKRVTITSDVIKQGGGATFEFTQSSELEEIEEAPVKQPRNKAGML